MRGFLGLLFCLFSVASLEAAGQGRPFFDRVLHPFRSEKVSSEKPSIRRTKLLTLSLSIDPVRVKLPETRRIKVTLDLMNHSRRKVRLEFPTTQRIEAILYEKNGKPLVRWSEDQSFSNEPGYVMVNPGEHLKYEAMLSTRDLAPGRLYEVQVFLPDYRDVWITKSFVPVD